jgi:hypothetical protein
MLPPESLVHKTHPRFGLADDQTKHQNNTLSTTLLPIM